MPERSALDDAHSPTSRHRTRASLHTTASAVADSTISFTTYATGFTEESLRLSRFPPPPTTIPSSPLTEPGFPSPIGSTYTFTPPASLASGGLSRNLSSPSTPGRQDTGRSDSNSQGHSHAFLFHPRSDYQPAQTSSGSVISPYDWHDGSSSIAGVDAAADRMLSTSFITDLLSSGDSAMSAGDLPPSSLHSPSRYRDAFYSGSIISEMTYPPPPSRATTSDRQFDQLHEMLARSGGPPSTDGTHSLLHVTSSNVHGDANTVSSYERHATVVQAAPGLSRKVSVLGMVPATLHHVNSGESLHNPSLNDASNVSYNSATPLHGRGAFESIAVTYEFRAISEEPNSAASDVQREAYTPVSRTTRSQRMSRERRASTNSNKSMKSQVSSFISAAGQLSARAARQTLEWLRVKPLPPVPTIPSQHLDGQERYRAISTPPLRDLVLRANRLNDMLVDGHLPHNSVVSRGQGYEKVEIPPGDGAASQSSGLLRNVGGRQRQSMQGVTATSYNGSAESPIKSRGCSFRLPTTRRGRIKLAVGLSSLAVSVIVAIVIGVVVGRQNSSPNCSGGFAGSACSLNATCVCTSSDSGQCNRLAQSLIDLIPTVNNAFNVNFTSSSVALAAISAFGTNDPDCSAQARVIDVAPALDPQIVPNRTSWAQSALLWSFVLSEDASSVQKIQNFVRKADWDRVKGVDGPIYSQASRFATVALGFRFDFAEQTISAPTVSFVHDGQAGSDQISQVSNASTNALNSLYTQASASSTIRTTAMANYWENTLNQSSSDYNDFVSRIISSPVLLPFDATSSPGGSSLSKLLTNSSTALFPPPLGCYPGLSSAQLQQLTTVEKTVFNLPSPTSQTTFDASCFPDRPVYGLLDILNLRLPFRDDSVNLSRQAAVLRSDVRPRVIVYSGSQFSSLPQGNATDVLTDVRRYGTMNHLNHVLFDFFTAIADINVAVALISYVLSSPTAPPKTDVLLQALDSIPTLEVAVFGNIIPSDIDHVLSSFATPSGHLFFGTDQSEALRVWAVNGTSSHIAWTNSTTAAEVVDDSSFSDSTFNSVWEPAYEFFHFPTGSKVDVSNITTAFEAIHKFSP
ncbi:hypothetical protein OF83DRAFT_1168527 [Amylostereum chailletii]|nr:hypothetical protein OF83DRAFT_1168527 [Amylostereum chailletii]